MNKVFYEELWINEDSMEQNLITTYSIKYRDYQKSIRDFHVEGAHKLMDSKSVKLDKSNPNDFRRLVDKKHCTVDGQIAEINQSKQQTLEDRRVLADNEERISCHYT